MIIGSVIIGVTILAAWIYYEIRLIGIYNNISTVDQAIADMQNPSTIYINMDDADIEQDVLDATNSDEYQYSNDGSDDVIAAVMINGSMYTGSSVTGVYTNSSGAVYDWNKDQINDHGTVYNVDPLEVAYGIADNDGTFTEA